MSTCDESWGVVKPSASPLGLPGKAKPLRRKCSKKAATVLLAAVGLGQGFQLGQKSRGLLVAVGLGEAVHQVVTEAEQEAGLPVRSEEEVEGRRAAMRRRRDLKKNLGG